MEIDGSEFEEATCSLEFYMYVGYIFGVPFYAKQTQHEVIMTTITLPPEVEKSLGEEAQKRGTTPELLAIDCLRQFFVSPPTGEGSEENGSLFDFLSGYIGGVSGTNEALSEACGQRFAQGLIEKHQRGHV